MKLPKIQGIIRRRILVNFRVTPEVMQRQLPARFRPKLHEGSAIAGICLIRLEQIRPVGLPAFLGISSENAAHRIAVVWEDEQGKLQEGVYIPRRDTDSRLNQIAGGRVFPGEHHAAHFKVASEGGQIDLEMKSEDGEVSVQVRSKVTANLPETSRFGTLAKASGFFELGSLGYSATANATRLDGLMLKTKTWKVEAMETERVFSSYFANKKHFPKGSVEFDCALLMRDIDHEWHSAPDLYV
jgi:hypothetical protein